MSNNITKGLATILIGMIIWFIPVPDGLTPQAWHLFALMVAIIIGFILQPVPVGAVAFIGITVIVLTETLKLSETLSGFSSSAIWLIVSAFLFARGFIKTGLGRRIAYLILRAIGDSTLKVGYALALSDLILAPATPSSAARAGGIIFPIARSLASALDSEPGPTGRKAGAYFLQVIYQTEAVVCAMFLTAMAGNPMIVELAAKTIGVEITWGTWALAACVPGIIAFITIPWLMYIVYPPELKKIPQAKIIADTELKKMGAISFHEKVLAAVFFVALILWCTSGWNGLNATTVAMVAVSCLLITQVLTWDNVVKETGAWDTLIWMGSLVGLAGQLSVTGFIPWFADAASHSMSGFSWISTLLLLVVIYMYSHYAFASLTAHISAMYAAFIAVAVAAGAPPYLVALSLAFTANICLPITHYSGAPGPIYYGAGYVDLGTWWKLGFLFSVVNLIIWIGVGSMWWKVLGFW
ncbi:anion permease [Budvicia aquatica]|uniref:anion permease n=1 Tax=Budvicia aquatica TaxID=82979 RepID=UPI002083407B|nr:anion permease [Budvicia aquatica]GKX53243.1 2-oxoglutarate translocator [Budvicia aquatica]